MKKSNFVLKVLFILSLIPSFAFAGISQQDFEKQYPSKCFEVTKSFSTKDKTSECRLTRMNFYMEHMSREPANLRKGHFAKLYSMIKTRTALENGWEL